MPFEKRSVMEQKKEFVLMYQSSPDIDLSLLCRRFGISRPTGYKWIDRYLSEGLEGLEERSRRPITSPIQTEERIRKRLIKLKEENEYWGAKKIRAIYQNKFDSSVPSVTTVHRILKQAGLVSNKKSSAGTTWNRFEYPNPNDLWQMDFKGDFLMENGKRCYPLTLADDHSRYNLCIAACSNQQGDTVKLELTKVLKRYGKPLTILCDNGKPWGLAGDYGQNGVRRITVLEKWLLVNDIEVIHGRPYHPETQGKLERFHKTLKYEVIEGRNFIDLDYCQKKFDKWRQRYNQVRPHESLDLKPPITKYQMSTRTFNDKIEPYSYPEQMDVRKVCEKGFAYYRSEKIRVGKALKGEYVGIQPLSEDSFGIYFRHKMLAELKYDSVKDVPLNL